MPQDRVSREGRLVRSITTRAAWAGAVAAAVLLALTSSTAARSEMPPFRHIDKAHEGSVLDVAFSPDDRTLVSSSRDNTIKIWDAGTLQLKKTLTNHTDDVYTVSFSRDGRLLASGSTDTSIILWDTSTWTPVRVLKGHTAAVRETEFSPDDKTLASVAEDHTLRLWDVATGALRVTRTEHTGKVKSVAYYPDGQTIMTVSHDRTVGLWTAAGEPKMFLKGHKDVIEDGDVSPDGRQLMSGTGTDWGEIIFWDARTGRMLKDLPYAHGNDHGKEIDSVGYTRDGRFAVSGSKDRSIKFWDPKTFEQRHVITDQPGRIESLTFSHDGRWMATGFGGTDFTIKVWDISGLH